MAQLRTVFLHFFRLDARKWCFLVESRTKYFFGDQSSPEIGIMCSSRQSENHKIVILGMLGGGNFICVTFFVKMDVFSPFWLLAAI